MSLQLKRQSKHTEVTSVALLTEPWGGENLFGTLSDTSVPMLLNDVSSEEELGQL